MFHNDAKRCLIMILGCKYCSLWMDFTDFDAVKHMNKKQCWVMPEGVNHVFNKVI